MTQGGEHVYPRIALVTLSGGTRIVFGTYNEYMSNDEATEEIKQKWWPYPGESPLLTPDVTMVAIVPNDGYPYRF